MRGIRNINKVLKQSTVRLLSSYALRRLSTDSHVKPGREEKNQEHLAKKQCISTFESPCKLENKKWKFDANRNLFFRGKSTTQLYEERLLSELTSKFLSVLGKLDDSNLVEDAIRIKKTLESVIRERTLDYSPRDLKRDLIEPFIGAVERWSHSVIVLQTKSGAIKDKSQKQNVKKSIEKINEVIDHINGKISSRLNSSKLVI